MSITQYPMSVLLDALYALDPDVPRDEWVAAGMAAAEAGLDFEAFLAWSRKSKRFESVAEARATWKSILRHVGTNAGQSTSALIGMAKKRGWNPPDEDAGRDRPPSRAATGKRRYTVKPSPAPARAAQAESPPRDDADEAQAEASAQALVQSILDAARPASPDHPYLVRKSIDATGFLSMPSMALVKIIGYTPKVKGATITPGELLIAPLFDPATLQVKAVEIIDADGHKTGLSGVSRAGLLWTATGTLPEHVTAIGIAEGIATAVTAEFYWRTATPHASGTVVSASSAGNLLRVAQALRHRYPDADIIVFGDRGNGAAEAERAANEVGGLCLIPPDAALPEGKGKDWNDVADPTPALAAIRAAIYPGAFPLLADPLDRPPPDVDFVLPGLPAGTLGLIAGPGAAGKTFLALQLAIGLALRRDTLGLGAQARDWFGDPSAPGMNVGLLLGEDDPLIVQGRMFSIVEALGLTLADRQQINRKITGFSLVGRDMRLLAMEGYNRFAEGAFLSGLRRLARHHQMLFIDPLVRLHDAPENDNTAASHLMTLMSRVAMETGCTIILLHHMGKAGATSRGASAYSTSVRWEWHLSPLPKDEAAPQADAQVRFEPHKVNYMRGLTPMLLARGAGGVLRYVRDASGLPENARAASRAPRNGGVEPEWTGRQGRVADDFEW